MVQATRKRAFTVTINNWTEDDLEGFRRLKHVTTFGVFGFEGLEEGETPHLQGYVYFPTMKSKLQVSKLLPRANLIFSDGTAQENYVYCTKLARFEEWGEMPLTQQGKGDKEADRWETAKRYAVEGKLDEIPADIFIRQYNNLKKIKSDYGKKPENLPPGTITGLWIWGPSGVGKSHKAHEDYPDAYIKQLNKWWCGYDQEETCIVEDWDPDYTGMTRYLKLWSDRYAFPVETKGSNLSIRPKLMVITSQYHIRECFPALVDDTRAMDAIIRRFKVIHMTEPFGPVR